MTTSWIAKFLYSPRRTYRRQSTISDSQHRRARCHPRNQPFIRSANMDDRSRPTDYDLTATGNGPNAKYSTKTRQIRCLGWWIHRLKRRVLRRLRKAWHNSHLANMIHCRPWTMSPKVSGRSPNPSSMRCFGLTNLKARLAGRISESQFERSVSRGMNAIIRAGSQAARSTLRTLSLRAKR